MNRRKGQNIKSTFIYALQILSCEGSHQLWLVLRECDGEGWAWPSALGFTSSPSGPPLGGAQKGSLLCTGGGLRCCFLRGRRRGGWLGPSALQVGNVYPAPS